MADNFLENRMADLRRGLTAHKQQHRNPIGQTGPQFAGKKVLVTGGAQGIGKAIVQVFTSHGADVAFCDIDLKHGNETAQQTGARFYHTDIAQPDQIERMMHNLFRAWKKLDIIVNNAAYIVFKQLADLTLNDWDTAMNTNLRSIFLIAQHFARFRQSDTNNSKGGSIINIASTRALMSEPGTECYSASKGAILALTHSLMASLAPLHVNVNCISPGWIHTSTHETITETDNAFHPSGRVGKPSDIAELCLFLASENARFINGENIVADGGVTRKMLYP